MRGTRNLKTNYAGYTSLLINVHEVGSPNGFFEDVCIGSLDDVDIGYASVYGDAMASEITHLFGVLGTRLVIQTGNCGALGDGMLAGDLMVPTTAGCGEGAARYYQPGRDTVSAPEPLVRRIIGGHDGSVPLHRGPIWTTSALLAEGAAEIQQWYETGHIAADMETASTFAVAAYFDMDRLSLLYVFDNPRQGDHLLLTESDKPERRERGEQAMFDHVLEIARERSAG